MTETCHEEPCCDDVEEKEEGDEERRYLYIAFHLRFQDEIDRDVVGPRRPLRLDHKASPLHSLHPVLHLVHQLRGWRCQWLQRHSAGRDGG